SSPQPSESAKAVEHLMPVKPVELAARAELSQSAGAAEAAAPVSTQLVDLSKEQGRKGRKGSRTRPKAAAKRAAKPAGTGPSRDEHSGVPPRGDHHGEHHGNAAQRTDGRSARPGDAAAKPSAAQATALVDETPDGGLAGDGPPGPGNSDGAEEHTGLTPAQAFDALYAFTAPGLVRQTYLLTGRRALAKEAVERAFHKAWEQWPEVAKDRDPVGWVRAVAYEYALSPWHRFRRGHRHPDAPPAEPEDRKLLDTLLSLPPSYRRTLVLYDGVGLDLPETAAETEASTPAAANRLVHAREAIAEKLPELSDPAELQRRLDELACAEKLGTGKATAVRGEGERRVRFWTRAAIAFTTLIIGASAITWITSAKDYEPKQAPGQKITGVPARPGPQILDHRDKQLREKLRGEPGAGPERVHPLAE
ncbi:RNA polymerase sigma factor, partial [Streptomyces mesophilus]